MEMMSAEINELAKALSAAQAMFKKASFDKVNPHFKSKYASLESVLNCCREGLAKNGLAITQGTLSDNGTLYFATTLMHSSGQWIKSIMLITMPGSPQALGSLLSYYRRYGISAMLALSTGDEDDDGNAAQESVQKHSFPLISKVIAQEFDSMIEGENAIEYRNNMLKYYSGKDGLKKCAESFAELSSVHSPSIRNHIAKKRENVPAN